MTHIKHEPLTEYEEKIAKQVIDFMGEYLGGNPLLIQENAIRYAVKSSSAIKAGIDISKIIEDRTLPMLPEGYAILSLAQTGYPEPEYQWRCVIVPYPSDTRQQGIGYYGSTARRAVTAAIKAEYKTNGRF